jgi:hypothetical protein
VTPDHDSWLTYQFYRKENQWGQPSQLWCLMDEDGETINDSLFLVDVGDANTISDRPSNRHGKSYEIGFADGHMENVKLTKSLTGWADGVDPDWVKLKDWTTVKR